MFLSGVKMNVRVENNDGGDSKAMHLWEITELEALWLAGRPNSLRSVSFGRGQTCEKGSWKQAAKSCEHLILVFAH